MDSMTENGRPVCGTALHRLHAASGERSPMIEVHAGDVTDVCDACDPKSKPVESLRAKVAEEQERARNWQPGLKLHVKADDLRALVDAALKKPQPAPVKAEKAA